MQRSEHRLVVIRVCLLFASLSALLAPDLAWGQVHGHGVITGRVLDPEKQPFENVNVSLYRGDSKDFIWRTATDELGSFTSMICLSAPIRSKLNR